MKIYFTDDDIWIGGPHQLALEIGEPDNQRLFTALSKLWLYPSIEGCYLDPDREPNEQTRVEPNIAHVEAEQALYGLALLPNNHRVACYSYFVREEGGSDWLVLCIPRGAVSSLYDMNDPNWEMPIDQWFTELGFHVFSAISYKLGLAGFHTSGQAYASELENNGIPEKRHFGYLSPQEDKLNYYPRNI